MFTIEPFRLIEYPIMKFHELNCFFVHEVGIDWTYNTSIYILYMNIYVYIYICNIYIHIYVCIILTYIYIYTSYTRQSMYRWMWNTVTQPNEDGLTRKVNPQHV